ncbi:MAG: hypothetical protein HY801_00990 [Candidatus Lindowbacteria bacterium]|nr:hypothetical protein [Candidatus Lindowbacteria bacterium]
MKSASRVAAFLLLLFVALPAAAANEEPKTEPTGLAVPKVGEIEELRLIHAESMTLTRQKSKPQVFQGAVDIAMVGKDGNETRIKAEKVTVYYDQSLKKVEKIEAEGRVKITRLDTVATTELAVYRGNKNTMELLKDPHVKDTRGELSANKITVFLDTNEVVAEGNVRGIVHPATFEEATTR